ncbi:MAG: carbon-nitrogen hydrolase family protein [Candidatus Muiribacterium halophilum]|uniref:Carbon-nitrogen hydrolase family protein n=1 Tax=Muiribacterium halophilum TaxID=2053465 RepID=A0A2N5ZM99_MUIH1|nr:MAG: carbon-nitrogen hydrolase family protein [Candidatus Muirbacterium halophilum]
MKKCKVCGVQITTKPLAIKENLEKMILWAEKAKKEFEPDLIVYPETITTTFSPGVSYEEFKKIVEPVPGYSTDKMCELAKRLKVDIVLPMYELKDDKIYNDSIYIDCNGEILGIYRKTHLFPTERLENNGWSTPGDEIVVIDSRFGKIGLIICYDGDFPELSRMNALRGAEVIIRPSALLRSFDIWDMTNKARAYDNHVYMVSVNAVGPDGANNYFFGHSMIVGKDAHKIGLARGSEEIVCAELVLGETEKVSYGVGADRMFDHIDDRNLKAYTDELLKPRKK